ncbi:MAG: hypothetical protein JXR48_11800 [Candidatus Delongbacteria bacterium]|nr:hypothetical protein [Candidatus Delongbacteria bacterium]MBN2835635.1 hypothetical protein [Candidatus Delongbacteria bacterium]
MKHILFILLTTSFSLFSLDIVDIEISVNLNKNSSNSKTVIVNCGAKDRYVNNGLQMTVYREFDSGVFNLVGRIEVFSFGMEYSKCRILEVSETIRERNMEIHSIALGDYCFPSVKILTSDLFQSSNSDQLTEKGKKEINNLVIPIAITESFQNMKINVYNDSGKSETEEMEFSRLRGTMIKKFLIERYKLPEDYIETNFYGTLQKMSKDDKNLNSFIDFVFIPPEEIYMDQEFELAEPVEDNSLAPVEINNNEGE